VLLGNCLGILDKLLMAPDETFGTVVTTEIYISVIYMIFKYLIKIMNDSQIFLMTLQKFFI